MLVITLQLTIEIIVQEEVGGSISADANRFVFLSSYLYMFLSIVPNFLCT